MRKRLLLSSAALAAFGGSLGARFVFDDFALFADPVITSSTGWWESWKMLQTRPLTWFSFWANYQTSGESSVAWHTVNVALHVAVVLALFQLLKELIAPRAAFWAALLFAVHPLLLEPVAYVFARSIEIATLGSVLAIWQWVRGKPWAAAAWFLVAMLGKEECAAVPVFLLLLDFSRRRRPAWAALATMFGIALALGMRVVWAAAAIPGSQAGSQAGISPLSYFAAQGVAILRYFRLVLMPWGFSIDPDLGISSFGIAALAWSAIVVLAVVASKWVRDLKEGFWFLGGLILLAPSSSILPAADLAVDRRMYLPMIAFAALWGLVLVRFKWPIAALVAALLTGVSIYYCGLWRNPEALWTEAVRLAPAKTRPRIQLARSVDPPRALAVLSEAPDNADIFAERGRVMLQMGRTADALGAFGRALALDPSNARAINNRGAALLALGQTDAARADFERALKIDPCLVDARVNLGRMGVPMSVRGTCR